MLMWLLLFDSPVDRQILGVTTCDPEIMEIKGTID